MRVTNAAKAIENIVANYAKANNIIADEDSAVVQKYIALGVIKLVRSKTPLQKGLYKPALEHEAVKDIPYPAWLYMFQHYAKKYNVKTALSRSQTAEYIFNAARYKMCPLVAATVFMAEDFIAEFKEIVNA